MNETPVPPPDPSNPYHTIGWIVFGCVILIMMALDLGFFSKKPKDPTFRTALTWVLVWVGTAMGFNVFVYLTDGKVKAVEFLTGYLIEQSLSIDNIFVFLMIFTFFRVPQEYQRRVLVYGIIGAIIMRGIMIVGASVLIQKFDWLLYLLGGVLIITGFKMWFSKGAEFDGEKNIFFRLVSKMFRITKEYDGNHFFTVRDGRRWATPLFMVLVVIEGTDLVFALDSIPAILAITHDQFILFTSNIFAILGLRSLYFVVHGIMKYFHHLHYGLSFILVAIGLKMIYQHHTHNHISPFITLGIIAGVLVLCIITSLIWPESEKPELTIKGQDHVQNISEDELPN
ncbi:TerC family protein [Candidatus Sumerlaeota bacterium]|nr:TerC family protein [Candidatus Sumerlaeota bacterium]